MIDKKIRNYLKAAFNLPVVHDAGQTKVENAISVSFDEITVKTTIDVKQTFTIAATVSFRSINGYEAIGYLSQGIIANPKNDDLKAHAVSGTETIEYLEKTEIVISKQVIFMLDENYDQVREKIKIIEIGAE